MANNIPHDGKVLVQIYVTPKVRALAKAKAALAGVTMSAVFARAVAKDAGSLEAEVADAQASSHSNDNPDSQGGQYGSPGPA